MGRNVRVNRINNPSKQKVTYTLTEQSDGRVTKTQRQISLNPGDKDLNDSDAWHPYSELFRDTIPEQGSGTKMEIKVGSYPAVDLYIADKQVVWAAPSINDTEGGSGPVTKFLCVPDGDYEVFLLDYGARGLWPVFVKMNQINSGVGPKEVYLAIVHSLAQVTGDVGGNYTKNPVSAIDIGPVTNMRRRGARDLMPRTQIAFKSWTLSKC
ncbi:hypothetical protein TWF694_011321 [Orbilia ellipsospora]|uniref:Uncharacterized protein n=1 Tax=Orbilia ellipsospora TaxID=2528407 RepID=A0AAV9X4X2_9PEZI